MRARPAEIKRRPRTQGRPPKKKRKKEQRQRAQTHSLEPIATIFFLLSALSTYPFCARHFFPVFGPRVRVGNSDASLWGYMG
jgi:hypothetical protein